MQKKRLYTHRRQVAEKKMFNDADFRMCVVCAVFVALLRSKSSGRNRNRRNKNQFNRGSHYDYTIDAIFYISFSK